MDHMLLFVFLNTYMGLKGKDLDLRSGLRILRELGLKNIGNVTSSAL